MGLSYFQFCCSLWANHIGSSRATPFELRFINKLPDTIFTQSKMIAEDHTPIQVALFDVRDNSIVTVGPLSSIKVELCALNGEFGFNGREDWTEGEFNANILRERDGKRPLLNGDRFITLKNGVGCVNKAMFTDNSRWIRSRKFRLGTKVVQSTSTEANIKEGRSDPFVVKDSRGECKSLKLAFASHVYVTNNDVSHIIFIIDIFVSIIFCFLLKSLSVRKTTTMNCNFVISAYKKHYPPSLNDYVWRLERIAKDGKIHKRLYLHGIHTVKDLLRLYTTNPSSLLEVKVYFFFFFFLLA